MTLRAKGTRQRRGSSPRRKEKGTVTVCPEVGRERRLMYGHLGAPAGAAVHRERRAPAAGSRAFIQDAGRRFAAIPHIRPGHADLAARGTCPADPRRAPTSREGSAMAERFVGIDVALREHRIAVLDRDGEAVGPSFTIAASTDGVATLLRTLDARAATAAQTLIGLEASGHLWESVEAALVGAGYRVIVLNPLQTRRYRDVVRRKAKTDYIDAHVIAGLLRSGAAQASYVPDEQIQSLRELARLRARLMADRQDYLRQLSAQLDVVLPEPGTVRPPAAAADPGRGPQARRDAAGGARRAPPLHGCSSLCCLCRVLPRHLRERRAGRPAPPVSRRLAHRPACPLPRRGQRR